MSDYFPVPDGEGPKVSIDTWSYIASAFGHIQASLGRLDAKIDGSASKDDVQLLRTDMVARDERMNARVVRLEQAEHDRQLLRDSHGRRDQRESMTRSERINRALTILALLGTVALVLVNALH